VVCVGASAFPALRYILLILFILTSMDFWKIGQAEFMSRVSLSRLPSLNPNHNSDNFPQFLPKSINCFPKVHESTPNFLKLCAKQRTCIYICTSSRQLLAIDPTGRIATDLSKWAWLVSTSVSFQTCVVIAATSCVRHVRGYTTSIVNKACRSYDRGRTISVVS